MSSCISTQVLPIYVLNIPSPTLDTINLYNLCQLDKTVLILICSSLLISEVSFYMLLYHFSVNCIWVFFPYFSIGLSCFFLFHIDFLLLILPYYTGFAYVLLVCYWSLNSWLRRYFFPCSQICQSYLRWLLISHHAEKNPSINIVFF